ncbi:hypothetical protein [Aurantiacibacter aquimixticola]|uniref:Uncharacterized protein n=1 Tax=Aurantiacibacter aquimixticola TaxID=1958945 RepID=A0A419RS77_9SPHN|nr:hypothetical protein [Aurantiacibacter aquimixticola]RJY08626.1 hypothetical protein D6201_03955 [Aurantiacibacter aquimixticola]
MTDHPSTFRADDTHRPGIQWDDRASLHAAGDGDGVLDGAKGLRSGTFAELIRHVMAYPAEKRHDFYIEKAGDREYHAEEIERLAAHEDFPTTA